VHPHEQDGQALPHRDLWWILSLVVNNTFRVFEHLVPDYKRGMRVRRSPYTLHRRTALSRGLIGEGVRLYGEAHPSAVPPWMAKRPGPTRRPPQPIGAIPLRHELVRLDAIGICARLTGVPGRVLADGRCAQ